MGSNGRGIRAAALAAVNGDSLSRECSIVRGHYRVGVWGNRVLFISTVEGRGLLANGSRWGVGDRYLRAQRSGDWGLRRRWSRRRLHMPGSGTAEPAVSKS